MINGSKVPHVGRIWDCSTWTEKNALFLEAKPLILTFHFLTLKYLPFLPYANTTASAPLTYSSNLASMLSNRSCSIIEKQSIMRLRQTQG